MSAGDDDDGPGFKFFYFALLKLQGVGCTQCEERVGISQRPLSLVSFGTQQKLQQHIPQRDLG